MGAVRLLPTISLILAFLKASFCLSAAEGNGNGQHVAAADKFFKEATLSTEIISDTRYRLHQIGENAATTENLNYSDWNLAVKYASGYAMDIIGIDLEGYASGSFYENDACSEIILCNQWDSSENTVNYKTTKAAVKFKIGHLRGNVGLTQLNVGTIGNVWSFVPGTYRGGSVFYSWGDWTLGYGFADRHTAPWWRRTDDTATGKEAFDFLHSLGLEGKWHGIDIRLGIGQAKLNDEPDHSRSNSYTAKFDYKAESGWQLGYGVYAVNDHSTYAGAAAHHGAQFTIPWGDFEWETQLRYTHTENAVEFAPRTVNTYGSNNGRWHQWWDALSDWNQDSQVAWYNRLHYHWNSGWYGYLGIALSSISEDAVGFSAEQAINGTFGYRVKEGKFKGSRALFHFTYLTRDMRDNSDYVRQDYRFKIIVPYSVF